MTLTSMLAELDVAPRQAPDDSIDATVINAVFGRQLMQIATTMPSAPMTDRTSPNIHHVSLSQLRRAVVGTGTRFHRIVAAALRVSVRAILSCGANKEMVRIYARRIIAAMQHVQTSWNRSIYKLPDEAVCVLVANPAVAAAGDASWPTNAIVNAHSLVEYTT